MRGEKEAPGDAVTEEQWNGHGEGAASPTTVTTHRAPGDSPPRMDRGPVLLCRKPPWPSPRCLPCHPALAPITQLLQQSTLGHTRFIHTSPSLLDNYFLNRLYICFRTIFHLQKKLRRQYRVPIQPAPSFPLTSYISISYN